MEESLVEKLSHSLPNNTLEKLQNLSHEEYQRIFSSAASNRQKRERFQCEICSTTLSSKSGLSRHRKIHDKSNYIYKCEDCSYSTTQRCNLKIHQDKKNHHGATSKAMETRAASPQNSSMNDGSLPCPKRARLDEESDDTTRRAINGCVEVIEIRPSTGDERYDLIHFIKEKKDRVKAIIIEKGKKNNLKFYCNVQVRMIKYAPDGSYEEAVPFFRSRTLLYMSSQDNLDHDLNEGFQKIFTSMEDFLKNGSGYQLEEVMKMEVTIIKYNPLCGKSYMSLPITLVRTHSLINIANHDNRCFMWSVLAGLFPVSPDQDATSIDNYKPFEHTLNLDNIDTPTPLSQVARFERQNQHVSVNVFGFEEGEIFPLYISKTVERENHVNLLFLQEESEEKSHYVCIKDLNRFLARAKKTHNRSFFCCHCLQGFTNEQQLMIHKEDCRRHEFQRISLPKEGEVLEFTDVKKTTRHPFAIYADFECLTKKVSTCDRDPLTSHTNRYQVMEAYSYAYQRVSIDTRYEKEMVLYRGPDAVNHFIRALLKEQEEIMQILSINTPMLINDFVRMEYAQACKCYVCNNPFSEKNHKVIDHCHVTGEVRGIACNNCNLKMQTPQFIPVVLHNLKGFDSHLIVNKLGKYKEHRIQVIPHNKETYLSFSIGKLRFIDSLQFLNNSLSGLTSNLAQEEGGKHFHYMRKSFPQPDVFSLLLRKGVFPYDYVDRESVLNERQLPPHDKFFCKLSDQGISEEDYQFATTVWEKLKVSTLGEYSDVYLRTDVALLTDIFERFRDICLTDYGLDPCHYYTLPGFSWSAMMKKTGVVLDLLTDVDMLLFIEKGVRGGVSSVYHRYAKANNPYQCDEFDPFEKTTYLGYFDANNLYGWSMCQPLPHGYFTWLSDEEMELLSTDDIMKWRPDGDHGYFLECSLEYPVDLHDAHSDFPLAPEKLTIRNEDLSPFSREMLKKLYGRNAPVKCEKLIPNLYDKDRYVVHFRNLQLYLNLGMRMKKVHRVLRYRQSTWLKTYIDFNTEKRKCAKNDFEKSLYKLLNNSIFGRSLMNTRKHVDIKLCHTEKILKKYVCKPSFKSCTVFCEDLVAVENIRTNILIREPIYLGFSILDLSKYLMYDFHYNHMKSVYGDRIKLLYGDTDSFIYFIETEDMYEDMLQYSHMFDTSDYPRMHRLYNTVNKKKLGVFKDEANSIPIKEFVGLRSKMYSFTMHGDEEKHTAKGIGKSASKLLKHEMYKDSLFNHSITMSSMNTIRSYQHTLFAQTVNKISLVSYDDKRYILPDGVTTRAYGHYRNNS